MRKLAAITAVALSLALGLGLSACQKKAEPTPSDQGEPLIVSDADATEDEATAEAESAPAEDEEEGEAIVVPVKRAQGPLAFVADDELCSILVTGKGSNESGYGYGIEVTNNSAQTIVVVAAPDATVGGTPVEATLSVEVGPEQTVEGVLTLPYNDSLADASAFEGVACAATLEVLDEAGAGIASYPVSIG